MKPWLTGCEVVAVAAAFVGLSLWGYTTKRDLSGFGTFLIMGVIGLIIASIVNMFLQSGTFYLIISGLGVLIFSGLIAYDTQRLKMTYYALGGDQNAMGVATGPRRAGSGSARPSSCARNRPPGGRRRRGSDCAGRSRARSAPRPRGRR